MNWILDLFAPRPMPARWSPPAWKIAPIEPKTVHILMTCDWHFTIPLDGTTQDETHKVHSVYADIDDAEEAARFWKQDDCESGMNYSRYWVVTETVEMQSPTEVNAYGDTTA